MHISESELAGPGLEGFVADLDGLLAAETDPAALARGVGGRLRSLIAGGFDLPDEVLRPDPERYRQQIAHVDPAGRYSVVALVWLPGQSTAIHDHLAWCVCGILRGEEHEHAYRLEPAPGGASLVRTGTRVARRGDVGMLVPPDEDIHRVANSGTELAVSLHVYGADVAALGSSVNRTYELPIVAAATA